MLKVKSIESKEIQIYNKLGSSNNPKALINTTRVNLLT